MFAKNDKPENIFKPRQTTAESDDPSRMKFTRRSPSVYGRRGAVGLSAP